LNSIYLG